MDEINVDVYVQKAICSYHRSGYIKVSLEKLDPEKVLDLLSPEDILEYVGKETAFVYWDVEETEE